MTVIYEPYGDTKQSVVDGNAELYIEDNIYDNKIEHYCKVCGEKMEYTTYKPAGPICVSRYCPKCGFTEIMTDEGLTVKVGNKRIMFTFFPLCVDGRIEAQKMIDDYRKGLIG